jgi:hypothetical protein
MSSAKAVPVLMYHHVGPHPGLVTVSPEIFTSHMEYLAARGYTTLAADDFLEFLRGRHPIPAKSVLITFDDGYLDNYVHAYPVLRRLGQRATIFAVTGWIGDGPARIGLPLICPDHKACKAAILGGKADSVMLRWAEIEEMEASGTIEIHSHTHTHTRWDQQIPDGIARLEKMHEDLALSRAMLQVRLGRKSSHLCWPQGYFQHDYQEAAMALGFDALYTTRRDLNTPSTSPQDIGRIVVKDKAGVWFANRLQIYSSPFLGGLYTRLRRLKG